jgi:arsenate reductase (thioredoxin)
MANALFVCLQNAGRSQMSQALFERAAEGRHQARSAGTTPAEQVHPEVVAAMAEVGIDLADRVPHGLTEEDARWADVVVTMGCGDKCPYIPGRRYVDWDLADPAGRPVEEVRATREEIDERVRALLAELDAAAPAAPLACSLGAADLKQRLAHVEALGEAALVEVERSGAETRLRFRSGETTRASLERFVEDERACCPFLDFTLAERADLIELTIAAPPGAEPIVEELTSAFSSAAG